jgi:hypothetical protein
MSTKVVLNGFFSLLCVTMTMIEFGNPSFATDSLPTETSRVELNDNVVAKASASMPSPLVQERAEDQWQENVAGFLFLLLSSAVPLLFFKSNFN